MSLRRASSVLAANDFEADEVVDTVTLSFDDRFRRRIRLKADGGLEFMLDLAEARVLKAGDGLMLEDGRIVRVAAANEALIEIRAASSGALARLAWHIGNRHLPAEIDAERILIRDDHVIIDMLKGLGAEVHAVMAPFNPEGGAYGQHNHDPGHHHVHAHGHDDHDHHHHDHAHDHDHDHGHCDHPDHHHHHHHHHHKHG